MRKINIFTAALALSAPLAAQPAPSSAAYRAYEPSSRSFRCEIASKGWQPFEQESPQGSSVHILGPQDPSGAYRTGIDIHLFEPGQAGFAPMKQALEKLRRDDKDSERSASPVRMLRHNGILARVFEITETRSLPSDNLPSASTALHHYVAMIQNGDGYFVITLSSTRESYLEYRDEFLRFLKYFRPLGYK